MIALALYKDANIFILDEPTASLDATTKKDIIDILKKLKNKYIILTSHDETLIHQCDVIYTIEDHKLISKDHIENTEAIKKTNYKKPVITWNYFLYKNKGQWFQFALTVIMAILMTVMMTVSVLDSFLQENELTLGIERANKAEMYIGKMNDATIASGSASQFLPIAVNMII